MFRDLPGYDSFKCATPPRFEDHPGTDPEPEPEPEPDTDGPDTDEWPSSDFGGEG